jgi:hypothetical protein
MHKFKKCTCIKTHTSGNSSFEENKIYFYRENYNCYTVSENQPTLTGAYYVGYTYLKNDFNNHFVDTIVSRQNRMESIFED